VKNWLQTALICSWFVYEKYLDLNTCVILIEICSECFFFFQELGFYLEALYIYLYVNFNWRVAVLYQSMFGFCRALPVVVGGEGERSLEISATALIDIFWWDSEDNPCDLLFCR